MDLSQQCIWCNNSGTTDDHIFPRSIGGTLQLAVPACERCQQEISSAEIEVSRRSEFALYRFDKGFFPRDRKKLDSGSIEAEYIFVKDDHLGGYAEIGLRSKEHPITLPSIEINTNTLNARCRGKKAKDIDNLINTFLDVIKESKDIQVCLLTDTESNYALDIDWWPRIFITLKGRLTIRARDLDEAEQFRIILIQYIQKGAFKDHSQWGTGNIEAGTPHNIKLIYDNLAIPRIVAKIAYALAFKKALPTKLDSDTLRALSVFIRGKQSKSYSPSINMIGKVASYTEWPDYHLAMLESIEGKLIGTVILYGTCFTIDLGNNPLPEVFFKPIVAISKKEGTESNFAPDNISESIIISINQYIKATS